MRTLLALALFATTGPARAELSTSSVHVGGAASPTANRSPVLGLLLDGGFPDGIAVSALYRPWFPIRLDAGVTYNLIGFGVRGGATLVPFRFGIAPLLRGELGHAFDGDARGLVGHFTTLTPTEQTLLKSVSYDYASVQLGLEIGSPDRMVFFVRGGLAWFWTTAQHFQSAAQANAGKLVIEAQDPKVNGTVPTVNLGLLLFLG
jgi:hypothetical protein